MRPTCRAGRPGAPDVASLAGHYDAVASIYRLALEENLTEVNPCARIPRPKVLRELQRREVLTVLEYAAFLTAARSLGPTHHVIAVLGGMLGLRASEMAGLTVDSLTTVRGYATLPFIGKGDKPAPMPVPLPALPAVQAAIDNRTSGPLLRTRSGAGMDRRSVHRYVARTAQAAGIARPIGPHALHRTVGTVGLNQGIPLRDVQRLLRHARPETGPWPATTSVATTSSGTPPTRSPASSPAGPADPPTRRLPRRPVAPLPSRRLQGRVPLVRKHLFSRGPASMIERAPGPAFAE